MVGSPFKPVNFKQVDSFGLREDHIETIRKGTQNGTMASRTKIDSGTLIIIILLVALKKRIIGN